MIATALEGRLSTTIRRRVPGGFRWRSVLEGEIMKLCWWRTLASRLGDSLRAESDKEARERSAILEYRVEASAHRLGARLEALRRVGLTPRLCTTPLDLRTERRKPLQHLWWL